MYFFFIENGLLKYKTEICNGGKRDIRVYYYTGGKVEYLIIIINNQYFIVYIH